MYSYRQQYITQNIRIPRNALQYVADQISQEHTLLCLDEFQVTDVVDALILKSFFSLLFENGCVLVTTSNRPPQDLYKDGYNRELFVPFIHLLEEKCEVQRLVHDKDYRQESVSIPDLYIYPIDQNSKQIIQKHFDGLTSSHDIVHHFIQLSDRTVPCVKAVSGVVCVIDFINLCKDELGSIHYFSLAKQFPVVVLINVPQFTIGSGHNGDSARRFVTLIDILYDYQCKLIISAEVKLEDLFLVKLDEENKGEVYKNLTQLVYDPLNGYSRSSTMISDVEVLLEGASIGSLTDLYDLVFSHKRTVSRLKEMQGESYNKTKA
ncbi:AFG1-like ATPase [Acrasis kona]|uniref:AFG1-like ATPase n=1 Tax=Acrasis kona TaxID=1008807 RepID=A0AAW2ZAB7_9EUKA